MCLPLYLSTCSSFITYSSLACRCLILASMLPPLYCCSSASFSLLTLLVGLACRASVLALELYLLTATWIS